jgi:hypothetical protein
VGVPEWLGDLPTWIGAGGALGAAWFAYQTIKSQRQQLGEQQNFIVEQTRFMADQRLNLRLERDELTAVSLERRWEQARQVRISGSWRASRRSENDHEPHDPSAAHAPPFPEPDAYVGSFFVENRSRAPLRSVEVSFPCGVPATEAFVRPLDERRRDSAPSFRVLATALPVDRIEPEWGAVFTSGDVPAGSPDLVSVFFTDDRGLRWVLDTKGMLKESATDGTS